ncbi:iron chaperone [Propionicicella superfundia]|uniref:iron chaperone n=1 Tax=Propionicicella superfundia TaxID=348582 RepID=UPI000404479B|nr:DUF1801 domain-containing protein [Propionicicella superfundia]
MGEVSEWVETLDDRRRPLVTAMIDAARVRVPGAVEGMSYGMPALLYRGRPLLAIRASKAHIGLYPFSAAVVAAVAARLPGYSLSKGTIRVTEERPLPPDVLAEILDQRVREIDDARRI